MISYMISYILYLLIIIDVILYINDCIEIEIDFILIFNISLIKDYDID
jgi:hypothetical protein